MTQRVAPSDAVPMYMTEAKTAMASSFPIAPSTSGCIAHISAAFRPEIACSVAAFVPNVACFLAVLGASIAVASPPTVAPAQSVLRLAYPHARREALLQACRTGKTP